MEIGQSVHQYIVERELGEGGVASVFLVRHSALGSLHALKILAASTDAVRKRLWMEGRVQANLRHPNVVAVTDVLNVNHNPALVLEYVDGPSLKDWLDEHRPSLVEAMELFHGVLSGVEAAHACGIIHRDLKPGNVMLDRSGDRFTPKVADFGILKLLQSRSTVDGNTNPGVTMGTPEYMSPEQIRSSGSVDHRTDLFALGCMLYELVCGKSPFGGGNILDKFNRIISEEYTPPRELAPELPVVVEQAIVGLLKPKREERIQDCGALRALLFDGGDASWRGHVHVASSGGSGFTPGEQASAIGGSTDAADSGSWVFSADIEPAMPGMALEQIANPRHARYVGYVMLVMFFVALGLAWRWTS